MDDLTAELILLRYSTLQIHEIVTDFLTYFSSTDNINIKILYHIHLYSPFLIL